MKFTFKRHSPTGPYRSFDTTHTDIKLKGMVVGTIQEMKGTLSWQVRLMVKDAATHSGWKWVFFKLQHPNEQQARDWVNGPVIQRAITEKGYTLHKQEP